MTSSYNNTKNYREMTTIPQQSLRQAKRLLRKEMTKQLQSVSPDEIKTQSSLVTKQILSSPTFAKAKSISVYVSMESGEVNTDEICRVILEEKEKKLYVPRFATTASTTAEQQKLSTNEQSTSTAHKMAQFGSDMKMLRVRDRNDFEKMVMNRWGIREPEEEEEGDSKEGKRRRREDALDADLGGDGIDLILAPGVAFDTHGGRLGHGKGYYDRYLERADAFAQQRGRMGPVSVALALQQQILSDAQKVPSDDNDRMLDAIVYPNGIIRGGVTPEERWQI